MKYPLIALLAVATAGCYTPYKDLRSQEEIDAARVKALADLTGVYEVMDSRANGAGVDRVRFVIKGGYPALTLLRKGGTEVYMESGPSICNGGVGSAKNPDYRSLMCDYRDPTYADVWYMINNITSQRVVSSPGLLGLTEGKMTMTSGFYLEVRGSFRNTMLLSLRRVADQ